MAQPRRHDAKTGESKLKKCPHSDKHREDAAKPGSNESALGGEEDAVTGKRR